MAQGIAPSGLLAEILSFAEALLAELEESDQSCRLEQLRHKAMDKIPPSLAEDTSKECYIERVKRQLEYASKNLNDIENSPTITDRAGNDIRAQVREYFLKETDRLSAELREIGGYSS